MTERELYEALVRLCQAYGTTTEDTYELLHQAVRSIETDEGDE